MDQRADQRHVRPIRVSVHRISRRGLLQAVIAVGAGTVVALAARGIEGIGSSESPEQSLQHGLALNRAQRYDEAIREYTKVIRARPDAADAYVYRGIAAYESGQLAPSVADFTTALQLRPQSAVTYLYRGDSYQALGQTAKATSDYQQALARAGKDERLAVTARTKLWMLTKRR